MQPHTPLTDTGNLLDAIEYGDHQRPVRLDYESAQERLDFVETIKQAAHDALLNAIKISPYKVDEAVANFQALCMKDVVADAFHHACIQDRRIVEEHKEAEREEQREHERIERAMVRR